MVKLPRERATPGSRTFTFTQLPFTAGNQSVAVRRREPSMGAKCAVRTRCSRYPVAANIFRYPSNSLGPGPIQRSVRKLCIGCEEPKTSSLRRVGVGVLENGSWLVVCSLWKTRNAPSRMTCSIPTIHYVQRTTHYVPSHHLLQRNPVNNLLES